MRLRLPMAMKIVFYCLLSGIFTALIHLCWPLLLRRQELIAIERFLVKPQDSGVSGVI